MSKFMQISHMPEENIPTAATPALASFTVADKSYVGRMVFINEDGGYDETGKGTKVVFLYEKLPAVPPNTKCTVHEFYKGVVPGPFVETTGKIISTYVPGSGFNIHGISYEDVDVITRG